MLNTRGERNNNPGNLEINDSIVWQGQAVDQTDPPYLQFIDPIHGIRALAKDLLAAQVVHGLNTVAEIINRFAPPSENATGAYVSVVAGHMGVVADDPITLTNPGTLNAMVIAVIHQENGEQPYDGTLIAQGVSEALQGEPIGELSEVAPMQVSAQQLTEPEPTEGDQDV